MHASEFDEGEFFQALWSGGTRLLLIGRRALVALGLPVLTADYDLWVHADDIAMLNQSAAAFGLAANRTPEDARGVGRYVLENDEHVDVLVARSVPTQDGVRVEFEAVWARRMTLRYDERVDILVPCIDDLILTKQWALRDKDLADIKLLQALKAARS
ncbi:MAG: hypothetical protein HY898_31265 [Deltaproteobacteria bacterium]|nr:hypothetical protein [Deltaproteobacteria bacterium]